MSWDVVLLLAVVGLMAGVSGGLLGIGGGLVMVPVLTLIFKAMPGNELPEVHLAVATSLATVVVTGISSSWSHHQRGSVEWPMVARLAPTLMLGAFLSGFAAAWLPGRFIAVLFGVFAIAMAVRLFRHAASPLSPGHVSRWILIPGGLAIGALSALVGIGGGSLNVPLLVKLGRRMQMAVGTASACGIPLALAGTLGWLIPGWQSIHPQAFGYVMLPAAAVMSLMALCGAPLGARLAHRLSARMLQRVFAVFLLVLGGYMLVS